MNIPIAWSFPIRATIFIVVEILFVACITTRLVPLDSLWVFYITLFGLLFPILGTRIGANTLISAGLCAPFASFAYGLLFPSPGSGFAVAFAIFFGLILAAIGGGLSGLVMFLEKKSVLKVPQYSPSALGFIIFGFLMDFVLFLTIEAFGGGYNGTSWF